MIHTITNAPDELMERYYKLAAVQEIPNIARYAFEWAVLAEDAAKAGREACAEAWNKRGQFYAQQAGGEYIRLIEGSFSELVQVSEIVQEPGGVMDWQDRKDIGDD